MKIVSVVGARPNFMKIAPIAQAARKGRSIKHMIVHTGQHYDYKMSQAFFKELDIPKPDINLNVGSKSHAAQTSAIMSKFEKVLLKHRPDLVIVVGDVNSTVACSLVATKLRIAVAHVEAGLRSFDRNMPEEINRLVTDSISDILFTTCKDADKNLLRENIPKERIFFVGNVMIDTLLKNIKKASKSQIHKKLNLEKGNYVLVTLHRPSNVDSKKALTEIFRAIKTMEKKITVVFPVHPRTRKNLMKLLSKGELNVMKNLLLIDPLGYFDFLWLMSKAKMVMTDSGGIQEETTVLGIPCLTLRDNTERPITVAHGTNVLVGNKHKKIVTHANRILAGRSRKGRRPAYWDGKASERIIKKLVQLYKSGKLLREGKPSK